MNIFTSIFSSSDSATSSGMTAGTVAAGIASALFIGFILSVFYMLSNKKHGYSQSLALTLIALPAAAAAVIMLAGTNVASALSLAGLFSFCRFRSIPASSRSLTNVFIALVCGVACGMGYIAFGAVFAVSVSLIMLLFSAADFGKGNQNRMKLKITVAEDMNTNGVFDEIFNEFTSFHRLEKIKSTNLGTLFELTYSVILKAGADQKEFIDALRMKNANLNIALYLASAEAQSDF
ncbi:MAG: DUF4956 domain-containing protein [Acutalibacteraceae bacterium]